MVHIFFCNYYKPSFFRSDDELVIHNYLGKYKEKLLGLIASPRCYYNQYLECFVSLTPEMSYQVGPAEVLTSCDQLQDLAEISGTEGMVWLTAQIQKDITVDLANLLKIVQVDKMQSTL